MKGRFHDTIVADLMMVYDRPVIENSWRGHYVERLVCAGLGGGWSVKSGDWAAWDLEDERGTKLEIKQSTLRQTWDSDQAKEFKTTSFDISEKSGFYEGASWIGKPGRHADIYVFAWHGDGTRSADHRDESQWEFYVVRSEKLPAQKSIGLNSLRKIAPPVRFGELRSEIERLRQ